MARIADDFIRETSTTTGTGAYTLAGAVAGFQSFAAVGDTNTCLYSAEDGTDWETGVGTYTASGTTLARTTILASSNGDAAVSWGAGTKTLRVTLPASRAVTTDGTETLTNKTLTAPVVTDLGTLDLAASTELTISSGAVTATQSHHTVDTEAAASSADLDTITAAGTAGEVLFLKAQDGARSVVLKHGTGNLLCIGNADITLDDVQDMALCVYDGTNWTVAPLTGTSSGGSGGDTWGADQNSAGYGIDDGNGNELLTFSADSSAVNHLEIANDAGMIPELRAVGDDANVYLKLEGKGAGRIRVENSQCEFYERVGIGSSGGFVDGVGQMNVTAWGMQPSSPDTGDIYLDDGTNTDSGSVNWMYYDGSSWTEFGSTGGP